MKWAIPIICALATLSPPTRAADDPGAEVLAQVARFAAAFRDADADELGAMLGPDYIHTNNGGSVVERAAWLAYIATRREQLRTGALTITRYENQDLQVRLHGDVAVVTGLNVSEGQRDGAPFSTSLRFTQVWRRTPDGWQRIAFHDTATAALR